MIRKNLGKPRSFRSSTPLPHATSSPRTRPTHRAMPPLQLHCGCEDTTMSLCLKSNLLLPYFLLSLCCLVNSNSFCRSLPRYHVLREAQPDSILPREAQDLFWISQHHTSPSWDLQAPELLYNMTLGNRCFRVSHLEEREGEKSLSIKFLWYTGLKIKGIRSSL